MKRKRTAVKRFRRRCAYCGLWETDRTKMVLTPTGTYRSESHFAHKKCPPTQEPHMSDSTFESAVRLKAWLRDYGRGKSTPIFCDDLERVIKAAIELSTLPPAPSGERRE